MPQVPKNPDYNTDPNDPSMRAPGSGWRWQSSGTVNGKEYGKWVPEESGMVAGRWGGTQELAALGNLAAGEGWANYGPQESKFRDAAVYQQQANPYSVANADRSRAAQAALFQQMQQQVAGPSVSDMQARQAMGGNLQAALAASAGGAGAAPVMNRAAGVSGGVAGDSGVARLAEQMRLQQAAAGQANAVRGGDLATQQQAMAGQFGANEQEAQRALLYAKLGQQLDAARAQAILNQISTVRQYDTGLTGQLNQGIKQGASTLGTLISS